MEFKLPEIKLFGKKIPLPENKKFDGGGETDGGIGNENSSGSNSNYCLNHMKVNCIEENEVEHDKDVNKQEADKIEEDKQPIIEELQNTKDLSHYDDNILQTPSIDEVSTGKQSRDSESDTNNSQTKKPDKIVPCPRCKSMETKFCYYNNYNVNQPRHYCKSCQRYWTAGGMMRNVPVGAGQRKNKNSCTRVDYANRFGFHRPSFKPNGTVLSFGQESVLNEKNVTHDNDFERNSNKEIPIPVPVQYYPNPGSIPIPSICPAGFPVPFYPTPLWNCRIPGYWSFPCMPRVYQSLTQKPSDELLTTKNPKGNEANDPKYLEGSILIPKTLRIGDPEEAAMSSIWTTLGIKSDSSNRGLFKAFQPKNDDKKHVSATSPLLQSNPAAVSRSVNFQETV